MRIDVSQIHVVLERWWLVAGFLLLSPVASGASAADCRYYPPPDAQGGWRRATGARDVRRLANADLAKLDEAFHSAKTSTRNGGLLVVRNGWLIYERYFGKGDPDATPNLASCGKSFTSIAMGILMAERSDLFPDGLDQKVLAPRYLPPEAFPLTDPAKADIRLGQLLAMTAGIRGNNPGIVMGRQVQLEPAGPDGWQATVDEVALGKQGGDRNTVTLWCRPGEGWSYATSSIHLVSMILRHVSGMELEQFLRSRLAGPLGWGRFGFGYRQRVTHTPGGGGIALRAADMLRFCYLLLRDGRWQDRQIVPRQYVRQCGTRSRYNPHTAYSLQFETNSTGQWAGVPRDAFWKSGSGGHCLYVVPSLDLIVWKLGGRDSQYDPRDTGLPAPAEKEWSKDLGATTLGDGAAAQTTLRLVVQAMLPGGKGCE